MGLAASSSEAEPGLNTWHASCFSQKEVAPDNYLV